MWRTLEGKYIRKRTHFQSSHRLHHLNVLCSRDHEHLNLKGGGRAGSSAQYPEDECRRIVADGIIPPDAPEGGRILHDSPFLDFKGFEAFPKLPLQGKLHVLYDIAVRKGLKKLWTQVVLPWCGVNQLVSLRDHRPK